MRLYLANMEKRGHDDIYTPLPVVTSTTFFLNFTFSGKTPLGCGVTFDVVDEDLMYHLDLRINHRNSGMFKKMVQSYRINQAWKRGEHSPEKLELKTGENGIKVEVGSEFFKVWINGVKFSEDIPVIPARLRKYNHLSLIKYGTCASFDLQSSFVEFPTGQ